MVAVRASTAGMAAAALAAVLHLDSVDAFGLTLRSAAARERISRAGFTPSLGKARAPGARAPGARAPGKRQGSRTGQGSSTSLWSSYVIKPDMAQSCGSEWRKLRTRGLGFREKVRRARRLPDLSEMLARGLSYLNADEAAEMQQALAMAVYAHSLNSKIGAYEAVKAGVETCLILGELKMGTDALLSAILSGILRPSAQPSDFGIAPVTVEDIEEGFGFRVARSVENFEHVMRLEEMAYDRMSRRVRGADAENGNADTGRTQGHCLRDLIISEATDWQVLTLHLAVHMQQLRSAISSEAANATQLARDALEIHAPLAHRLGVHQLSSGLEDLAFKALFPSEYEEVRQLTKARMGVYQEVMESAKLAIHEALHKDDDFMSQLAGDMTLQHRIKEPYSMWKKMQRNGGEVDSVYDAVALRVILKARRDPGMTEEAYEERSRQLCYHATSVAKKLFQAVEGRCKDYVANPKPNGYQSLHSAHKVVISPEVARESGLEGIFTHFELQVRTASMHHKAEYGHASHWSYKSEGKDDLSWMEGSSGKKTWKAYRPRIERRSRKATGRPVVVPESVSSGRELVTWLHLQLRQRKVFVFGPDNLIWELDKASATAANVLDRTRGTKGSRSKDGTSGVLYGDAQGKRRNAYVNGKAVPLHYAFKNGDVLDVAFPA